MKKGFIIIVLILICPFSTFAFTYMYKYCVGFDMGYNLPETGKKYVNYGINIKFGITDRIYFRNNIKIENRSFNINYIGAGEIKSKGISFSVGTDYLLKKRDRTNIYLLSDLGYKTIKVKDFIIKTNNYSSEDDTVLIINTGISLEYALNTDWIFGSYIKMGLGKNFKINAYGSGKNLPITIKNRSMELSINLSYLF